MSQSEQLQVPKTKEICSQKKYYDVLYSYLQCISTWDKVTNVRSFNKKEINFSKLAKTFGLSRQTVSTRFKSLREIGLVRELNDKEYELIELENKSAMLIPYSTLKILTDALNDNAISTYAYLFNEYYKAQQKKVPCVFTLEQIKDHIGICATTRSNDNVITNILFILQKIGLIKYSLTSVQQEKDSFHNIKTIYRLDYATTKLK